MSAFEEATRSGDFHSSYRENYGNGRADRPRPIALAATAVAHVWDRSVPVEPSAAAQADKTTLAERSYSALSGDQPLRGPHARRRSARYELPFDSDSQRPRLFALNRNIDQRFCGALA